MALKNMRLDSAEPGTPRIDLRSAARSLQWSILYIYLAGLSLILIVEAIYLSTGNKTWQIFILDLALYNTAAVLIAFLIYRWIMKTWRKTYSTESTLHSITEIASEAVYSVNSDFVITGWSKGAELIYGFTREEALGKSVTIIRPDDFLERDLAVVEELASEGVIRRYRTFSKRKDGSIFPAEASLSLMHDHNGEPSDILAVTQDITLQIEMEQKLRDASDGLERKVEERTAELKESNALLGQQIIWRERIEKELRKSEEHFRSMIENAHDVILIVDRELVIQYVSPSLHAVLGYVPEDVVGYNVFDFIHPDDAAHIAERFSVGLQNPGITISAVCRVLHADNEWRYWESVGTNLLEDPAVVGIVLNCRDITERKDFENKIQALNKDLTQSVGELADANRELEAFSYSVSHDLRAPLRAIGGFGKILLAEHSEELDEEGKRLLDIIISNTEAMEELIEGLLALSGINREDLRTEKLDMASLAENCIGELDVEGRDVEFIVGDLPSAEGGRALVRQVFLNLISNAVKFTGKKEKAVIEIGSETQNGQDVYFVRDNGDGFDMKHANNLFGVFKRLHREDEFPGLGIGLATVQRIINMHGGRVWAEGKKGEGATFYFCLAIGRCGGKETPCPDA